MQTVHLLVQNGPLIFKIFKIFCFLHLFGVVARVRKYDPDTTEHYTDACKVDNKYYCTAVGVDENFMGKNH